MNFIEYAACNLVPGFLGGGGRGPIRMLPLNTPRSLVKLTSTHTRTF